MISVSSRHIVLPCLVLLAFPLLVSAEPNVSVEVRGLRIVGPGIGKDKMELRPFNWMEGTEIAVLVKKPDGGIIGFDKESSELKFLVDDKRTNLLEKPGKKARFSFEKGGFGSFPAISKDGKACLIEIEGKRTPAAGATSVSAEGIIILQCGSKTKKFKHENAVLQAGTKINAGKIPFTINKVGKPGWGKAEMAVTLHSDQDLSNIKEIRFLDTDGNDLKAASGGTSTSRFGNKISIDKSFNFKKKIGEATIEITYWMDMKNVSVPLKLKTSVGIGQAAAESPEKQ